MSKPKQTNPLTVALKERQPFTITVPDGGDLASMRGAVKHGQSLTLSPVSDHSEIRAGDIVYVKWRGENYILHLVGDVRDDQFLIVNSSGGINGWVSAVDILGVVTKMAEPAPRPGIPEILNRLEIVYQGFVKIASPAQADVRQLCSVIDDMRWYAERIGAERWTTLPSLNKWSFEQHLWHVTQQARSALALRPVVSIHNVIDNGKYHVGKIAEILILFEQGEHAAAFEYQSWIREGR